MINDEFINLACVLGITWLPDVETVLSIISIIIITGIAVLNFVYKWKKYKEDGVITDEEKKDLLNDVNKVAEEIKDKINK